MQIKPKIVWNKIKSRLFSAQILSPVYGVVFYPPKKSSFSRALIGIILGQLWGSILLMDNLRRLQSVWRRICMSIFSRLRIKKAWVQNTISKPQVHSLPNSISSLSKACAVKHATLAVLTSRLAGKMSDWEFSKIKYLEFSSNRNLKWGKNFQNSGLSFITSPWIV